jgi:cytochrome c biogenesis factor
MTVDPRTDVPDAREIRGLWVGLLLPPIAFLINLEAAYALVPAACSSHNQLPVHLVHIVCLLLAVAGGLTAGRWWKLEGVTWPGEEGSEVARSRFMAGLGVLLSALFILVIVAMWIPSFLLDPCQ